MCVSVPLTGRSIIRGGKRASLLVDYFRSNGNGSVDVLFAFAEQIHRPSPLLAVKSAHNCSSVICRAPKVFIQRTEGKGKIINCRGRAGDLPAITTSVSCKSRRAIIPARLTYSVFLRDGRYRYLPTRLILEPMFLKGFTAETRLFGAPFLGLSSLQWTRFFSSG